MIDEIGDEQIPSWSSTNDGINKNKTANFEGLVNNKDFFRQVKVLQRLTSPLSAMTHHSEAAYVRTSWLLSLMKEFYADAVHW